MAKQIITLVYDDDKDITSQLTALREMSQELPLRDFCTSILEVIQGAQVEVNKDFNHTLEEMDDLITSFKTTMSNLYFSTKTKE
jgi:hypothetical protein